MRRTHRVRRGTSLQRRDRTAGDSSPVTQENGRLRGRPKPAGLRPPKASPQSVPPKRPPRRPPSRPQPSRSPQPTRQSRREPRAVPVRLDLVETVAQATPDPARCVEVRAANAALHNSIANGRYHVSAPRAPGRPPAPPQTRGALPPAPLLGTDAALTSVLTAKGPADPSRGALRSAPTAPQSPAGATSPPSPAARRRSHRRPRGRPAWRTSRPSGRRRSTRGRTSVSSRCVRR